MARQTGLGRALEIILSARDFDADEAEAMGTINKAFMADEIDAYKTQFFDPEKLQTLRAYLDAAT
ncbi:hypothetical protein [Ascidiaceihabitans sp.]|uniref:hypothetical protein n=1 Tax=Ascidiaceihabitans sp. TaxID=1872644 RepID=UPI00329798A1